MKIFIKGLLPPSPNSTRREHFMKRSRRFKSEKRAIKMSLFKETGELTSGLKMPLTVTFTRCAPRLLDWDNSVASMKAEIDAVAEWLGTDDRDPRVTWKVEQRKCKRDEAGTEIRIEARA